jgi:hypothetical protein
MIRRRSEAKVAPALSSTMHRSCDGLADIAEGIVCEILPQLAALLTPTTTG